MTETHSEADPHPTERRDAEGSGGSNRRAVIGGSLGNLVEWYDWAVYGYFATFFSHQFFPTASTAAALLLTLSVFAVGFFMRPLGGLVLGNFGDRHGRRAAMLLTVALMTGATLLLAVLPTYGAIGIAAPALLLVARLIQGFSAGGEFGSSAAFLVENAPAHRRGYVGSFQQMTVVLGLLLGSLMAGLLTNVLSESQMQDWGWRIAFGVGAAFGLYTLALVWRLPETQSFRRLSKTDDVDKRPWLTIFTRYPLACLKIFAINMLGGLVVYLWAVYLPTYAHLSVGLPQGTGQLANILGLIALCVFIPLAGALSDRYGRRTLLLAYAGGFAITAYPMLHFLTNSLASVLIVTLVGVILLSGWMGCLAAVTAEQFPAQVRATGIAFPYSLAIAIFGGTAPLIATYLLQRQAETTLALYIAGLAVISVAVFAVMPETKDAELT